MKKILLTRDIYYWRTKHKLLSKTSTQLYLNTERHFLSKLSGVYDFHLYIYKAQ